MKRLRSLAARLRARTFIGRQKREPNQRTPLETLESRTLMDALYSGKARLADMVEVHMDPALPSLGAGEPVTKAVELLEDRDALMVLDDGKPVGVLTRQDLLVHLSAD